MNFDTIAVNALGALAKRTGKKLAKKNDTFLPIFFKKVFLT